MTPCGACGREIGDEFACCPYCGAPSGVAPPTREQRKRVTILFCDVTDSTALGETIDPEALRSLLAGYFERMKGIIESHGGTVEKFIGDAVMVVFGMPILHEDDALRAVRAASEMQAAVPELGLQTRIGVNSGEVVAGTRERLATGDAVNVATRLEQAAAPGEVLIGAETLLLVTDAIEVEAVSPLQLKGKSEPVPAYRLLALKAEEERSFTTPMIGRKRELDRLQDAFAQAVDDRSCQLFTVLGAAGVGKSRLALEFLQGLHGAQVVRGRCLSYGEGITYWPVVEVMRQFDAFPADEYAASALQSLLGGSQAATTAEEIAWAFRKLRLACRAKFLRWRRDSNLRPRAYVFLAVRLMDVQGDSLTSGSWRKQGVNRGERVSAARSGLPRTEAKWKCDTARAGTARGLSRPAWSFSPAL